MTRTNSAFLLMLPFLTRYHALIMVPRACVRHLRRPLSSMLPADGAETILGQIIKSNEDGSAILQARDEAQVNRIQIVDSAIK